MDFWQNPHWPGSWPSKEKSSMQIPTTAAMTGGLLKLRAQADAERLSDEGGKILDRVETKWGIFTAASIASGARAWEARDGCDLHRHRAGG